MPVYTAFWMVIGVASGLIFYQEYRHMDPHRVHWFAMGILTTLLGLWVLTKRDSGDLMSDLSDA
eukprot:gene15021-8320_t